MSEATRAASEGTSVADTSLEGVFEVEDGAGVAAGQTRTTAIHTSDDDVEEEGQGTGGGAGAGCQDLGVVDVYNSGLFGMDMFGSSEDSELQENRRVLDGMGVSEAEIAEAVRVVEAVHHLDPELLQSRLLRPLRKASRVFIEDLRAKLFQGEDMEQYELRRLKRAARRRREQMQRNLDLQKKKQTAMREQRYAALRMLTERQGAEYGAGWMLTDGSETQAEGRAEGMVSDDDDDADGDGGAEADDPLAEDTPAAAAARLRTKLRMQAEAELVGESELIGNSSCYTCKRRFLEMHHFYDRLCPSCAALNWEKRNQMADLRGRVALLTGSRVKIGFQCGLRLLRCGATLIATTRFPHDAAERYANEVDYDDWSHRLHIYGLDMRDLESVAAFTDMISNTFERLDIIVNNAAQTVRRPPAYYRHLMGTELQPRDNLPPRLASVVRTSYDQSRDTYRLDGPEGGTGASDEAVAGAGEDAGGEGATPATREGIVSAIQQAMVGAGMDVHRSAALSQLVVMEGDDVYDESLFPSGKVDVTGQQLDLRQTNSWLMRLHEVSIAELLEVFAINAIAPFIIDSRLKHLMLNSPPLPGDEDNTTLSTDKFIVNVSAMEGKFYRHKNECHPHTNMAKAALNMMTRTAAQDYAKDGIFMTAVDTGWITDENPFEKQQQILQTNFQCPIDEVDAMARILDPVLAGYNSGAQSYGVFLKDFVVTEW